MNRPLPKLPGLILAGYVIISALIGLAAGVAFYLYA